MTFLCRGKKMTGQDRWADGWVFYRGDGKSRHLLPPADDCLGWIKGYAAAQADYDLESFREHGSIEASLADHGIAGELLESCLVAAESAVAGYVWCRWPSVPVRKKDEQNDRPENLGMAWVNEADNDDG